MVHTWLRYVLGVGGGALVVATLVIDRISAGSDPAFGPSQILALVIGLLMVALAISLGGARSRHALRRLARWRPTLVLIGLALGLLATELGFRAYRATTAWLDLPGSGHPSARHFRLLEADDGNLRIPPGIHQHDDRGFRNEAALESADIVAIGDSQTWGHNVGPSHAWPQQLAALTGTSVYNMGVPKAGPVTYHENLKTAVSLTPRIIIVGLYLGNDLWDAERVSSKRAAGADSCDDLWTAGRAIADRELDFVQSFEPPMTTSLVVWLREHSAIVDRLARADRFVGYPPQFERARAWAQAQPNAASAYVSGKIATVAKTAAFLLAMDLEHPCVAHGLELTRRTIRSMSASCRQAGASLVVALIPTKASVVAPLMRDLDPNHERLVAAEARLRAEILADSDANGDGVTMYDLLEPLTAHLAAGERIYPSDADDHFTGPGYRAIAVEIERRLRADGLL